MPAAYGANDVQTIQPGSYAIFTTTFIPCTRGLIQHMDGTPLFSLAGWAPNRNRRCCCKQEEPVIYKATANMNVALSEGAAVAPIMVAIAVEGAEYPISEMDSTPSAVGDFNHIGTDIPLPILYGCCQNVAIKNIGTTAIDVKNLIMSFDRPDLNG